MRITYWALGALALLTIFAGTAAATHFRYGTLSWEPTENENEALFTGGQAWRASAFGSPEPGAIIPGESCLDTGDGACETIYLKVNARSYVNDYFSATFVDAFGNEGIRHTYATPDDAGSPWAVSWSSCCRISPHSSGNYHVNNPDQSERLMTFVDLDSGNAAPRSTLPPINACPREALCTIPIPAADRDGDDLAFRLSSSAEAGDGGYVPPGPPHALHPASVGASSGVLSWDTRGATVGDASEHTLYSVQVMIEDDSTQTPLDFFIEILPVGVSTPYWVIPPTPCGQTLQAEAGVPLAFDVRAASDDPVRVVRVSHLGLPTGALFPPVTPGNPASGVFSWTPTQEQGGEHLVVFAAEDDLGYPAPACAVTIVVAVHPPPEFITPAACGLPATIRGVEGLPISFPVVAHTVNLSRDVTITLESGPLGLAFPPAGPANPASGLASWPAPYAGAPSARFLATDSFGIKARCIVPFDIDIPTGQAFTLAAWAGSAVPVAAEYASGGHDVRAVGAGEPTRTRRLATFDAPQIGLHAEGITEWAGVDIGPGVVTSTAGNEIERVSIADGAVVLVGLRQDATASWAAGVGTMVSRQTQVAHVFVAGQEVPVDANAPTTIPFVGGYVTLFGRSDESDAAGVSIDGELVHVYLAPALGRHEAILGSVILQAGGGFDFRGQTRSVHAHDDLRSGADAGSTRNTAMDLALGPHDANMPVNDAADAYAFSAAHGEKIVFVAQPAPGVYAAGGRLAANEALPPFAAAPGAAIAPLEAWRARLFDPTGVLRETSLLVSGGAARVELNADLTGEWLVILDRDTDELATNYTLSLSVTPIALLPQNDALSLADAAPTCVVGGPGIPLVQTGLWPGVVRDDDFADVYRFTAEIGELVAVTLKPGEDADGAAMGLRLYDRDCQLLASMDSLLGVPKGELRLVASLPSQYAGDYYTQVVRLNGVANHYVQVDVVNPQPTLPLNDALTGADAPDDASQAIVAPPAAFQGRLHEGDAGDAYKLALVEGRDTWIAFSMSALSQVDVRLYDPNGFEVAPTFPVDSAATAWSFTPALTGDYTLVVLPVTGGGNYSVVWGQEPTETPDP